MTTSPTPDRVTAIYDAIDAFQREHRTVNGLGHAQIRGLLAEHLDRALPAVVSPPPATRADDRAALRDRIAEALIAWTYRGKDPEHGGILETVRANAHSRADAVLAVLPPAADRAAVLHDAAIVYAEILGNAPDHSVDPRYWQAIRDVVVGLRRMAAEAQQPEDPATLSGRIARRIAEDASALRMDLYDDLAAFARETGIPGLQHAQIRDRLAEFLFEGLLRRAVTEPAAEAQQQPEMDEVALLRLTLDAVEEGRRELRSDIARLRSQLWTLAAIFEGFGRLLATSSRDWGQYAPDAWLYAVICGWDCEEAVHDETCTHGAMEEMQQRHGWDDKAVAKARRYRAVVHTLTAPAAVEGSAAADIGEEARRG